MNLEDKKVCMVVLNDFSHDSRVLREARALTEDGWQVYVLALANKGLKPREFISNIQVRRLPLKTRWLLAKTELRLVRYSEFVIKAFWQIKKIKPAICHCHDFNTLIIGYLAKKLLKTHLIYDSHELESQKAPGEKKDPAWLHWASRRLEHFLIQRVERVITVSDGIADYLVKQDNIRRPLVLRNIAEANTNKDHVLTKAQNKHFGLDKTYKIVIYEGGLQVWRGLINLIHALKFLPDSVVLALVGDGPFRPALQKEVKRLRLDKRVIFTGWQPPDSLLDFTAQADLGIISSENICLSYYFTLPSKFFEYLTAGLPILASHFPDMTKIIKKYQIGETFNPANPKDISRAIGLIFQNQKRYQTLKKNVMQAQKTLNWQREKLKLINLYQKMACNECLPSLG